MAKTPQVIFFGNGPLSDFSLKALKPSVDILFHARSTSDLDRVVELKKQHPEAFGILASFGVLLPKSLLDLFEPTGGIINLHPSLLPKYRGPSPIESAILAGDTNFSYSIMKLAESCDSGPIYHQATLEHLPLDKSAIYDALATTGATWLLENLENLPAPVPQDDSQATYTKKLSKSDSFLEPEKYPAQALLRQIIAYQGFPKPKYTFFEQECIILKAHTLRVTDILCEAAGLDGTKSSPLMLKCADKNFVVIDQLQPAGKKPMDAISFYNGYGHKQPKKSPTSISNQEDLANLDELFSEP